MPQSQAERLRELMAGADRQAAHDAWAAECDSLGHPPTDDDGEPIPDPLNE